MARSVERSILLAVTIGSLLLINEVVNDILVSTHDVLGLNRSEEMLGEYVKARPEDGDGYVGYLEVFHQLHCLVSFGCPCTKTTMC